MDAHDLPAAFHETVLQALDTPVLVHDEETILFLNEAGRKALHADSDFTEGTSLSEIIHTDAHSAGAERRRLLLESGQPLSDIPLKLAAFDGSTVYAVGSARRISLSDRPAIVLSARITDRK